MPQHGHLSEYFVGAVAKRLSAVEASPHRSNQHEFNGVKALKDLFGESDRKDICARFIWLADDEESQIGVDGFVTWYDARAAHPTRTEHRLYFSTNPVTDNAAEGDLLVVALTPDDTVKVIVGERGSTAENQLLWLFGLAEPGETFSHSDTRHESDTEIGLAARFILDELEIDVVDEDADLKSALLTRFGLEYPRTDIFSNFARETLPNAPALDDPDEAITMWMDQEERLFRMLEREVVAHRLETGFFLNGSADVDGFVKFSLSVQNRRKSRAGYALEHHLQAILETHQLTYTRGPKTENGTKPDFVFPEITNYWDPGFPAEKLTILGVKSSCKDRWRQVLAEGKRVSTKHLLTLEPGISENQTNEMIANDLQLVVPKRIQTTYKETQRGWLLDMSGFLALVRDRQPTG